MNKTRVFFYIALGCILGNLAHAKEVVAITPAREMSIRRILIPFFKIKISNGDLEKKWTAKNSELQENLIRVFTDHSSIEPILSIKSFDLDAKPEIFVAAGQTETIDALLLAVIHDSEINLEIVSALTGRIVDKFTISINDTNGTPKTLATAILDLFLSRIHYTGFVTATHKSEAKVNVGSRAGIKSGDQLVLFDFNGDQPTFSSPMHRVGIFTVNKVTDQACLGTYVLAGNIKELLNYTKVFIPKKTMPKILPPITPPNRPTTVTKPSVSENKPSQFWMSAGVGAYSLNTQVSGSTANLQTRSVQVPLSPAGTFGLGYSRFSLDLLYSGASNSNNSLSVFQGAALFKIISPEKTTLNFNTSIGVYISQEQVTPAANPTTVLVSSLTYAPEFQESLHYNLKASSYYGALDLFFPVFSNDSSNGSSTISSAGAGLEAGWHYDFTNNWAGELNLQARYFSIKNQNGGLTPVEFQVGPRGIYSF